MPGSGLDALVGGGTAGYDWMSRVLDERKTKATAEQKVQSTRALAERMAQGPTSLGGAVPPPTGAAPAGFAPTTAGAIPAPPEARIAGATDMGINVASMDEGGIPPIAAEPTPGPNDPDVNQFELETKQRTGRDVPMGKDWDSFRQQLMQSAAAIGDPQTVVMIDEYVSGLQQKGFSQNASRAQMAATMGDQQGTAYYLQKAFGYMNSGDAPRIQAVEDGNFIVMPVDESTGKPSGNPLVLNAKTIGNLVAMAEDPAKFAEWKAGAEEDAKKADAEIKRGEATTKYQERTASTAEARQKETARHNLETETTALIKAKVDSKGGAWNNAAAQRVAGNVNTRFKSIMDRLGKTAESSPIDGGYDEAIAEQKWLADRETDIVGEANTIAKATKDLDGAASLGAAIKIKQLEDKFGPMDYAIKDGEIYIKNKAGKTKKLSTF